MIQQDDMSLFAQTIYTITLLIPKLTIEIIRKKNLQNNDNFTSVQSLKKINICIMQ